MTYFVLIFIGKLLSGIFCLFLLFLPSLFLGIKAIQFLETGTECDTDILKDRVNLFITQQTVWLGMFFIFFFGTLCFLFGLFEIELVDDIPLQSCGACFGIILLIMFKLTWCILFSVAYNKQVPDCLEIQDITFAEAYIFLKPLLIIESIFCILIGLGTLFLCLFSCCFSIFYCCGGYHFYHHSNNIRTRSPYNGVFLNDIGDPKPI